MSATPLDALDPDEHDLVGVLDGGRGLRGYECRRCGAFYRSPESFEAVECHDRHP